jgi:flagellar hook assembly protein FlgD
MLLTIFNANGREVIKLVDKEEPAGYHTATWNAVNLPTGVYFYKMQAGNFTASRKLLLLK